MNLLDLVLLALLGLFAASGYRRGALSLLGGYAGAVAGLLLGAAVAPEVAGRLASQPGLGLALLTLGLLLVALLAGQALGLSLGHWLRRAVAGAGAAPADRVAGLAIGAAGLLVAVWLLGGVLAQGPWPALSQQLRESRIATGIEEALPPPPDVLGRASAYLDRHGFPQAFSGLGDPVSPPVDPPEEGAVAGAAEAGQASTVRIEASGCGAEMLGSGFATAEGFVVTNAHVIAGADAVSVRDLQGRHEAVPVHFDDEIDLAVLRVPALEAPPLGWVDEPAGRGTGGAALGYPGQATTLQVRAASVRERTTAVGHDIYGAGRATRDILALSAPVERGDSGGPFVTGDGGVGGVLFAASRSEDGVGYALTAESVRDDVEAAVRADAEVGNGRCRF